MIYVLESKQMLQIKNMFINEIYFVLYLWKKGQSTLEIKFYYSFHSKKIYMYEKNKVQQKCRLKWCFVKVNKLKITHRYFIQL